MGITLNVGCGDRRFKNFAGNKCVNIDKRRIKGVDVVADVRRLPFKNGCADYVLASDVLEHFPISETNNILTEWNRAIKSAGVLEIRCPNLYTICKNYVDGKTSAKLTSWLLYGAQDYALNFHYVAFDKEFLSGRLGHRGFDVIDYVDEGNNFILKGRKA